MATLLVIGGTGFFGKSILDMFQRGGLDPWCVDRVLAMSRDAERIKSEAPSLLSDRVELLSADIATTEELPQTDYVIHAAASTDARNYLSCPLEERRKIQAGTLNYCRLAKKFHENSKILFVSSGAVYGTQPKDLERFPEEYSAANIADMQEGKRDYAIAKRDAESSIRRLGLVGLSVSIARCFAFVGPWLPRDQHFAIGNFIEDGLTGLSIAVKARHEVYRSYMYADDLVEWLMTIADYSNPQCPTFNVGSDHPVRIEELARLVACQFGKMADVPEILESQVDRYVPSTCKIRDQLGVVLKYDLLASIQETIYKINKPRRI